MIRAGKLLHHVTIEQRVAGSPQQKPSGEPDETWTELAKAWASVEPLRGRELLTAQQLGSEIEVRVRMRKTARVAGVDASMRISYQGKIYGIVTVIEPALANRELEIMCKQGLNNG